MEKEVTTSRGYDPVNTKSLLAFIFGQMGKLNRGEIDYQTAMAQAKLASQANNVLDYELKRAVVQMRLKQMGENLNGKTPHIREIESKGYDETI